MGNKGDKRTSEADLSAKLMEEKLSSIGGITTKKMFGGYGVFHQNKMFGLINPKGEFHLKAKDELQRLLENVGGKRHSKMPYYTVEASLISDLETLLDYSRQSIQLSKD